MITGRFDRARVKTPATGRAGAICGSARVHYREERGGQHRLCRFCFARAVKRERRRCPPLPAAIDPAALQRAGAAIGRCDVCGLKTARWHGDAGLLCDDGYRREVRRAIEVGTAAG